jgi:ribose 5-phosphate isomerase A
VSCLRVILLQGYPQRPPAEDIIVRDQSSTAKRRAALAAANLVESGMIVGLGSGTTAALVVQAIGERIAREGLKIVGIATSVATAELARSVNLPLRELDEVDTLDLNIDGADEVDRAFRMIKGRGGALLREKIVVSAARRRITVVTADKRVDRLGSTAPIPVEISSMGLRHTERRLRTLGAQTDVRLTAEGSPFVTDGGNRILDCQFPVTEEVEILNQRLHQTVGVFETGIFLGLLDLLIVGYDDRVDAIENSNGVRA